MNLDEAIDRYTNNAEYERTHGSLHGCLEFRQLAEWLKDYKRLLEQQPCEDAISRQAALNSLIDNTHLDGYDLAEALDAIENKEKLPPVTQIPIECDDAISRKAVLEPYQTLDDSDTISVWLLRKNIEQQPPVTPQQKYGEWIYEKRKRLIDETDEGAEYITDYWCKCSNCDGDFGYRKMKDAFCKYCGAKLIEPQESEEV